MHPVFSRPGAREAGGRIVAIVNGAIAPHVGQPIPMGRAMAGERQPLLQPARRVAGPLAGVGHERLIPTVGAGMVFAEGQGQRNRLAAAHQACRRAPHLGRDVIQRADLVVAPPAPPVPLSKTCPHHAGAAQEGEAQESFATPLHRLVTHFPGSTPWHSDFYLMACGFTGLPVPFTRLRGWPAKRNS